MRQGTRVMFLGHPEWRGGRLQGFEGEIITRHYLSYPEMDLAGVPRDAKPVLDYFIVSLPCLAKWIYARPDIICPVYNDCEVCGYGAWGNVNTGTEKSPDYHHYCAWHLTRAREEAAA